MTCNHPHEARYPDHDGDGALICGACHSRYSRGQWHEHELAPLARYIAAHGFEPRNCDAAIEFDVPWIHRTGECGTDTMRVTNLAEARIALGY